MKRHWWWFGKLRKLRKFAHAFSNSEASHLFYSIFLEAPLSDIQSCAILSLVSVVSCQLFLLAIPHGHAGLSLDADDDGPLEFFTSSVQLICGQCDTRESIPFNRCANWFQLVSRRRRHIPPTIVVVVWALFNPKWAIAANDCAKSDRHWKRKTIFCT